MAQHDQGRPGPNTEEKSAGQELADGLGSLFRAAKKVVAEVDQARLEALGKKAFQELDATRLGALGRKAIEKVERFDPADLGRVTDLFGKAVESVESFVRQPGHETPTEPSPTSTSSEPGPTAPQTDAAAAKPEASSTKPEAGDKSAEASASTSSPNADEPRGATWRIRVDE